jgi:hypothetical protein
MKKITIRLDEQVHTFLARLAAERQVSFSQLVNETLERFVVAEQGFEMLESRAAHARPGAMRKVLDHTAAHGLAPLSPEDHLPPDVDRRLLETRLREARSLHKRRPRSKHAGSRDEKP